MEGRMGKSEYNTFSRHLAEREEMEYGRYSGWRNGMMCRERDEGEEIIEIKTLRIQDRRSKVPKGAKKNGIKTTAGNWPQKKQAG